MNHLQIMNIIVSRDGSFRGYTLRDQNNGNIYFALRIMGYFTTTLNQNVHNPQPNGTYRMVLPGGGGFPTIVESARQMGAVFRIVVWMIV